MSEILGEIVEWSPVPVPSREALDGRTVQLEPVDLDRHLPSLWAAAQSDPAIWTYLPNGPFEDKDEFQAWLETRAASQDPLFFAVRDLSTGRAEGMVSYMRMTPAHGVIEIGHIWFGTSLQRTTGATEAIYLLLRHAFDQLGYRRVEWKCNALNQASLRAAERFGFSYEGIFRQHMVVKGRNRDTSWFAMLDREWPDIRAAFEQWLAPENFDSFGKQRRSLTAIRASIR